MPGKPQTGAADGDAGLVLKSSYFPTAPSPILLIRLVPELKCFGGICLDYEIGGLNVIALETSQKMGCKMVWMPTIPRSTPGRTCGNCPAPA